MLDINKIKRSYTEMIEDFVENQDDWKAEDIDKWCKQKAVEMRFILDYYDKGFAPGVEELHTFHTRRLMEAISIQTRLELGKTFTYEEIKYKEGELMDD